MAPGISVIIPAYDCEETIINAIRSAENQTLSPTEIIVVDDNSKDDTGRKVSEYFNYRDGRILLRHYKNQGQNAAQNTGLDHVTGEYIAFLDDEDEYFPRKLRV